MKIPRAENNVSQEIIAERVALLSGMGIDLSHTTHYSIDPQTTTGNIENFIGVAQVPVGLAGPVRINGEYAQGDFVVPLATTEGALVASYSRGMRAITESGGCHTLIRSDFFLWPYIFTISNLDSSREFTQWCEQHFQEIAAKMEETTRHGRLLGMKTTIIDQGVLVYFEMSTGDAMGANMVVGAGDAACKWIASEAPGVEPGHWFLVDMGKKAIEMRTMRGMGKSVIANVVIPEPIIHKLFRTNASDVLLWHHTIQRCWMDMCSHGRQCMFANGLSALFIACGQDVAYVPDATNGRLAVSAVPEGGVRVTADIPCLLVGTVGGGSGLATQKECLRILGCEETGSARKFAEIAAAVVLAGEISLLGAASADEFVGAHQRLGRNRPEAPQTVQPSAATHVQT
ncbi:MAG: hydroxymethylglutaryl-CoA reductase [Chloroflexota bacterium]|nr:hydroxymethylglutaryl-CoA reductase [Chloroflexota bacterium]